MTHIWIDITSLMMQPFLSGIQRVVIEVSSRMLKAQDLDVHLLKYSEGTIYREAEKTDFIRYADGTIAKNRIRFSGKTDLLQLPENSVFFDADAAWTILPRRSWLYPQLKDRGVYIVSYLQDILPITSPQYFLERGDWAFLSYVEAIVKNADRALVTTETTKNELRKLICVAAEDKQNLPIDVTGLGADFSKTDAQYTEKTDDDIAEFCGKYSKYILVVGTIEPRKNHQVILDAYEEKLREAGIGLVFAGRIGWKNQKIIERITKLDQENSSFAFFQERDNRAIRYLYRHAWCVAFPTFSEGYGLPLVEALQYGIPVIASDIPVLREIGTDHCLYCDPHDPEDWETTILDLAGQEEEYARLKESADQFTPEDWNLVTKRIIEDICRTL